MSHERDDTKGGCIVSCNGKDPGYREVPVTFFFPLIWALVEEGWEKMVFSLVLYR